MSTRIQIILDGSAVEDHSIDLRKFNTINEQLQKLMDTLAYAVERMNDGKRDRKEVKKLTALRIRAMEKGSFAPIVEFANQNVLFAHDTLIPQTVVGFIDSINSLNGFEHTPSKLLDQGVLKVFSDLGSNFEKGLTDMKFFAEVDGKSYKATYDKVGYQKVRSLMTEWEEVMVGLRGHLLMANVGNSNACHLHVPLSGDEEGYRIYPCTYHEFLVDDVKKSFGHEVQVVGIATLEPVENEIHKLFITKIIVLDDGEKHPDIETMLAEYNREFDVLGQLEESLEDVLNGNLVDVSSLWGE